MNFLTLHFSNFIFRWCKYFSLFPSTCPESFFNLMLSLKNLNLVCIKFGGPVLSELPVYLIWRSFQKIVKFKSVYVCVCACVCVCAYKYDKSRQYYSCHMQNTISRITLGNRAKFQKFRNWKFKNIAIYTRHKILPAWNVGTFPRRLKCCTH